jgi:hypothetical protein
VAFATTLTATRAGTAEICSRDSGCAFAEELLEYLPPQEVQQSTTIAERMTNLER